MKEDREQNDPARPRGFLGRMFFKARRGLARLHRSGINRSFVAACQRGQELRAAFLLALGADPRAQDNAPLKEAAARGHVDILLVLFRHGKVKPDDLDGEALLLAVHNGHRDVVKFLLSQGLDIHVRDDAAIVAAASHRNVRMIETLAVRGANLNARDGLPLKTAISRGHEHIVEALLAHGAALPDQGAAFLRLADELEQPACAAIIRRHLQKRAAAKPPAP